MQFFAAPLRPAQQTTHSLRARQYKPSRKRKREDQADEDPISSGDDTKEPPASSNAPSFASSQSQEVARLRVAGLLPEQVAAFEIPPGPFPHAPARLPREKFNSTRIQQELARLDPPLFAVNATSESRPVDRADEVPALKQTHLGVLTTIMHRCLLEGDYQRAGRAWGIILRTQMAGLPIDPRSHNHWGIGAEILLRRDSQHQPTTISNGDALAPDEQLPPNQDHPYSEKGFELAREYYERLIVQYPNRKQHRHVVDERTFYPAMFSLWIYEVSEKTRRAKSEHDEHADISFNDSNDMLVGYLPGRFDKIREDELAQAKEIMQRLDHIIVSPPFDKHADLLQMRGMVGLWVGDLTLGEAQPEPGEWSPAPAELSRDSITGHKEHRLSESLRELTKSLDFLHRAQQHGRRRLDSSIYTVELKIKDLSKEIEEIAEMHR
ncbi:hypothetical protein B0J11DRAFT_59556 [Dendryphion nanum]|uniref:Uncharacterized protein n=1 Tax=Dendryphion nanum TaxID=256645 RepID=A0A9P9DL79_9PLEO|nr:hypothetical protein B0J11DRAFT_59556 [Dendryphion nanum]